MDLLALAKSPIASFVASFSPRLKTVLDFTRSHEDLVRKGITVAQAAEKEGPAVIDAVRSKAPELINALRNFITAASPDAPVRAALAHDISMENVLRGISGLARLSPQDEKAWLDRATPHNDPSQENSQFGG